MNLQKNLLLFLPALLITKVCFATSNIHVVDIEDLMRIFYFGCSFSALAVILCIISYFSRSKALNIIAWITGILSFVTSQVITHTGYGMLAVIIPFFCLMILLARMEKNKTGLSFLILYLLKSIALLFVSFNTGKMILEIYFPDFLAVHTYPYQIFLVLFFNMVLGFLIFRLLTRLSSKAILNRGIFHIVWWGIITGGSVYLMDIIYMIILAHSHRYHIDISVLLIHVPYLNIFINLFCWVITGLIVYGLFSSQQKRYREEIVRSGILR